MKPLSLQALLLGATPHVANALSADGWAKQSIYQLMTDRFARTDGSTTATCDTSKGLYCGGTWQGIIDKLDYIQGMGFTAIWISPIVKQLEGETTDGTSFHGFWAQDIWSVNDHFGSASDLVQLSDELHNRGMYLMVDIVTNHYAYQGCLNCVDYSIFSPFDSSNYFHDPCLIDWNDESTYLECWEGSNNVPLPDLRTEDQNVRDIWTSWISEMISTYGIDGLRIDSARHIEKDFHTVFEDAAGCYTVGEVLDGDPDVTLDYMNYMSGVMNYPVYYWLRRAFGTATGDFSELSSGINRLADSGFNTSYLGNFLSNHDQETWKNVNDDITLNKNALTFLMTMDGIPIVFEGHEQGFDGDWTAGRAAVWFGGYDTSSELYTWIASLNQIRNNAVYSDGGFVAAQAEPILAQDLTMAMKKSSVLAVYSSVGTVDTSYDIQIPSHGYGSGEELVEMLGCSLVTVNSYGVLTVTVAKGMPLVLRPLSQLEGSGICPDVVGGGSGGSSTTTTTGTATSATATSGCTATAAAVTFKETVTTEWGETIKVVGSVSQLGAWDTSSAISLGASEYTSSNPVWSGTVTLPNGVVEYKFINVASDGSVEWEADPNHTLTVNACAGATTVASKWQS